MKCIQCGTDNNLKDRTGNNGRCKQCQHPFVFEPTAMGETKLTDPMFAKAIADLSANNTLFFTTKQVFYLLENRFKSKLVLPTPVFIFLYLFLSIFVSIPAGGISNGFGSPIPIIVGLVILNSLFIFFTYRASQSAKGSYRSRREYAKNLRILGGIILVGGLIVSVFLVNSFILFVIAVILGITSIYLGNRQLVKQSDVAQICLLTQPKVEEWIGQWERVNPPLEKLLPSPRTSQATANLSPDVTAYSFDRLVVCDNDAIAQFLIANNFHFENNCAVLSINGYPQAIFQTTLEMVRRNPELKVFVLHDCNPRGMGLAHQIRNSSAWFQGRNITIVDVGLSPRQVMNSGGRLFVQQSLEIGSRMRQLPTDVRQGLLPGELRWLEAENFVELESLPPQRLIQILHQTITDTRSLDDNSSDFILMGDSGSYIYASDTFG